MRRWFALLFGTAALALAGTALALAGSSEDADTGTTTETTAAVEEKTYEALDFESIPEGMLNEDKLPPKEHIEKEPVDETPPEIVILHPEDGQVFERREVVFEGETEPGARVFAGDHEADVSDSGAWRIVLLLDKGENHVTMKAVDASENVGSDTVTVVYRAPKPKPEPKEEKPKEEPKEEKPKEEPKEENPAEWEFSANQLYGECGENPPYDVFWGTGKPGSLIHIESEFGGGTAEIGEKGGWEIKVIFESAPVGEEFAVYVTDKFGNKKVFEFIHTG